MKRRGSNLPRRIRGKGGVDNKSRSDKRTTSEATASRILTAEETADLFLSELAAPDTAVETVVPKVSSSTRSGPIASSTRKSAKKAKKAKSAAVVPKAKHRVTAVPLEEGEEDLSVAGDVLQHAAAFLARLSPAQSRQFWALRQVARGEKNATSVPVAEAMEEGSSDEGDEEETSCETSIDEGDDDNDDDDDVSSENEETNLGKKVMPKKVNGKTKHGGGGGVSGGGSLFVSNGDMWDD